MSLKVEIIPVKIVCRVVKDDYCEYPKEEFIEIDISKNSLLAQHIAGEIIHTTSPIPRETRKNL